jgi:tRNA nucleotidyltransferase (CCA-adding enzyme)
VNEEEIQSVLARVIERIRPEAEEVAAIWQVADRLIAAVTASGAAEPMVVGSVARSTFVRGDRDLDLFMLFPPNIPREALEEQGLGLARSLADQFGGSYQEKYAEHPYINTTIDGIDVDLVPCYKVASATAIQSAVDRTPFHTRYVIARIGNLADDVLLLKQFAKACGVYGSDQMTEGFAGYLCELLVLHYGGFLQVLAAAAGWRSRTVIDLEQHAIKTFDEPLVVVDPVDPNRNVSASVSLSRMFEFVEMARGFLEHPGEEFFIIPDPESISREALSAALEVRGTCLCAVTFATPPFIEDVVVPQLRRSLEGTCHLLERSGFMVNRADACMGEEQCLLLFELLAPSVAHVRRHIGPPLSSQENAEKFQKKYSDPSLSITGPYIEDGRYVVEVLRQFTTPETLLGSDLLLSVSHGKHVRRSLKKGWQVRLGGDCWSEEFAEFFNKFMNASSPLVRLLKRGAGRGQD